MKRPIVLIVDDEERNLKLLRAFLARENYDIRSALRGETALQIVSESHPDIILTDVMMPGLNGFEMCRKIKENDKTKMIPVVMVTALNEKKHHMLAMEAGADDFLSKPVDRIELLVRVKSMLRIKRYQDEILQSKKVIEDKNRALQKLQKTREGLVHMIIHDLRNPLSAISGYLELINLRRDEMPDKVTGNVKKCLELCENLEDMIQGLLDIYKMENGNFTLKKELCDSLSLVKEQINQFSTLVQVKGITLEMRHDPDIPLVNLDRNVISRVLGNLLANAIRHTPSGGHIILGAALMPGGQKLRITVRDNGEGLPEKYHKKVFEMFEQVALREAGAKTGSSGLGLAFCKMAISAHGGEIWVDSKGAGEGSTFGFTIPIGTETD